MPSPPVVPGVARVELLWSDANDTKIITRRYWSYTGAAPDAPACLAAATVINAVAVTNFRSLQGSDTAQIGTRVTDLSSGAGGDGTYSATDLGTRTGANLPASTCVVVNDQIARRYRGGKPRSYLPFGTVTDLLTQQSWTSAFTAAVLAAWNAFVVGVNGGTLGAGHFVVPVNVSFYQGFTAVLNPITGRTKDVPKYRATPVVDNVTGVTVLARLGSQRRRISA